ncbi:uncharacterized protein DS421_12g375770 [Arachis hypogaea]|nr:uncharacterized protein DS421_12g375770 [Arachis hypogaea]
MPPTLKTPFMATTLILLRSGSNTRTRGPSALLQLSKAVKDHILCSAAPVSHRHSSSDRSPSLTKTPTVLIHLGRLAAVAHGVHVGVAPTSRRHCPRRLASPICGLWSVLTLSSLLPPSSSLW